jgi:hypothetical protein
MLTSASESRAFKRVPTLIIPRGLLITISNIYSLFYGINGASLLYQIPSLSFPNSFPYNFMHLIFENICPMLINHWTSTGIFKGCQPVDPGYQIALHIWEQIGSEMTEAYKTIPSDFVGAMPDISKSKYKAQYRSFWMLHIRLTLLRGRFPNEKFYKHYC